METNKQKKQIRMIFMALEIIFLASLYLSNRTLFEQYNERLETINTYYPEISNLNNIFHFHNSFIISDLIVVAAIFSLFLFAGYLYIVHIIKSNNQHILHIVDEINNDQFVPSVLEGEYGLLEEKVYNIKKNNDRYIEALENEKKEMSDYIENIAHQIKTPLTSIRLNEEILHLKQPDVLLEKNQQSFERLDHLLDSLLKLTRLEHNTIHFDLQLKDIYSLFESVQTEIQPLLNDTKLEVKVQDCTFYYDEQWLKEALYNIIKNCIEEKVTKISMTNQVYRHTLQIIIKDNGQGIKEEDLPHIFERFYRSIGKKKKGNGIGLALCKEIIEKHHGHIHAYNDDGAVFEISIPILDIKEKVI